MRRIRTYVMIVGVALSAAPFFNYALAQQGGNSTELLLQVQTMRQEIAELRDMIERQQFQMKRLQQQSDAQSQQFEAPRGYSNTTSNQAYQGDYSVPSPQPSNGLLGQETTTVTVAAAPQPFVGNTVVSAASGVKPSIVTGQTTIAQQQNSNGQAQASPVQQTVQQVIQQQAPAVQQQAPSVGTVRTFPPVVDRSFSTSIPVVPVTGAGTQLPVIRGDQDVLGNQAPINTDLTNNSNTVYSAAALANTAAQNAVAQVNQAPQPLGVQATDVGVISIPSQSGSVAAQAQQIGQVQGSVNVAQIPSQVVGGTPPSQAVQGQGLTSQTPPTQLINNQVASNQVASNQVAVGQAVLGSPGPNTITAGQVVSAQAVAVLSEDDYYAQGFELLKQSKYEEAASIFEQQLSVYPKGDLADDAHYWIAEAMHVSRKLDVAKVHLKAIISDYPQSRRLPDAMLKTAYIEQSQGNQIEARILFQEIVSLHPQSDAAIAAKNQLAAVN